jgi:hypothetical protein
MRCSQWLPDEAYYEGGALLLVNTLLGLRTVLHLRIPHEDY